MTITPPEAQPGDIVFCHSAGIIGRAIRLGEALRWRKWSTWNHVAVVVFAGQDPLCAQAAGKGVVLSLLSEVAPKGSFEIVRVAGADGGKVAAFARSKAGVRYGFLTIASIVVSLLTPRFVRLDFRRDGTFICSALGALALLSGGSDCGAPDYYQVTPAQLREALP